MIAVNSSIHQSPSPFETSEFVHGAVSSASPTEAKVEEHIRRRRHHVSRTERASDITLMSNDGHDEQADQVAEKLCSRRQHINKRVRSLDDTLVVADSKLYEDRSFSTWSGWRGFIGKETLHDDAIREPSWRRHRQRRPRHRGGARRGVPYRRHQLGGLLHSRR
jgi:hypothetical protein